jgi:hypothetical protein
LQYDTAIPFLFVKGASMKPRYVRTIDNKKPVEIMVDKNLWDLPKTLIEAKSLGVKHYFPRTICPNGHLDKRNLSGKCLTCDREKAAAKRIAGGEKARQEKNAYNAKYREENKEKIADYMGKYRKKNRKKLSAQAAVRVNKRRTRERQEKETKPIILKRR